MLEIDLSVNEITHDLFLDYNNIINFDQLIYEWILFLGLNL